MRRKGMKLLRFLVLLFFSVLLVPGVAFGTVSLMLQHPGAVTVGEEFQVTVKIIGDDQITDPANVCGYETLIGFDATLLDLTGYRDDLFFTTSDMGGTCIYTPIGSNCGVPGDPGQFGSMDISFSTPVSWNYDRATATYTFRALQPGNIQFTALTLPGRGRNEVTDCTTFEAVVMDQTIINGTIRILPVTVPTLSQYGMIVFMLAMILCAFVFMRRRGRVQP